MNFSGEQELDAIEDGAMVSAVVVEAAPLPSTLRKEALSRLDEFVAVHGMPSKAVQAMKKAAESVPLMDLAAFFKRAVVALAEQGLFRGPTDSIVLSLLDDPAAVPEPGAEALPIEPLDAEPEPVAPELDVEPAEMQIIGDPINRNWHSFHASSGSRHLPRDQMPQISAGHRGALVNFLRARGVSATPDQVPAESLKPTQAEFSPQKVRRAAEFVGGDRSILVSEDGHVLDGTHQWLKAMMNAEPVKIIRLGAPIDDLLRLAHQFPSSTTSRGASRQRADETEPGQPEPAFPFRQNADGTLTVLGDPDEVQAALPGIRGMAGRDGVTFGVSMAEIIVAALYAMNADEEPIEDETAHVENAEVGAEPEAQAAEVEAPEAGPVDGLAAAGVPDERPAVDVQAAGVEPEPAEPAAPEPDPEAARAERLAAVIDLRKRESILKSIMECLQ